MQKSNRLFILLACLAITGFSGCIKEKQRTVRPPAANYSPAPVSTKNISYLALGDSYTIGHSLTEKERFPYQAAQLLNMTGFSVSLKYIAQSGWATYALQNAIAAAEPLGSFDMVSLLIGVNDQYQGLDTAGYRVRFTQLLEKSISLAKGNPKHVFVLSIPDYSATPFVDPLYKDKVGKEIEDFNDINKAITLLYGISYTDVTGLSKEVTTNPSLLADDALHYAAAEYAKWAELLVQAVIPALK